MSTQIAKQPLSNIQLRLLELYAQGVSDEDLKAIQRLIVQYFAEKATILADEDWDKKGYSVDVLCS